MENRIPDTDPLKLYDPLAKLDNGLQYQVYSLDGDGMKLDQDGRYFIHPEEEIKRLIWQQTRKVSHQFFNSNDSNMKYFLRRSAGVHAVKWKGFNLHEIEQMVPGMKIDLDREFGDLNLISSNCNIVLKLGDWLTKEVAGQHSLNCYSHQRFIELFEYYQYEGRKQSNGLHPANELAQVNSMYPPTSADLSNCTGVREQQSERLHPEKEPFHRSDDLTPLRSSPNIGMNAAGIQGGDILHK